MRGMIVLATLGMRGSQFGRSVWTAILLPDAEGGEDQVEDVVGSGLAGE